MRPELIGPLVEVIPEKFLNKVKEEQNELGNGNFKRTIRDFSGELLGRPDWVVETDDLQWGNR
jgi:hypothetical protein